MPVPEWLDTGEYPFASHVFQTPVGKMHYVDEGAGEPVVFVHGNPAWSFEFRHLIRAFSTTNRCIAPDHIGFGLSDKPGDWSYLPQDHAKNLELFLESLRLNNITLVVGDWGGPIGLSYAINHADRIKNIVITNTWLWSVRSDWYYQAFSRFAGGFIGRWLIYHENFFAGTMVRSLFGDKSRLTEKIHRHYLMPLAVPDERKGCWIFPQEIIGSSAWLQTLWERRNLLKDKNILVAWGMKDIGFRKKELDRWSNAFPRATVVRFEDAGHFVAEEKPEELVREMRDLMAGPVVQKQGAG
jgi:pimeloyl-ACP methyl ester carboxylesterase